LGLPYADLVFLIRSISDLIRNREVEVGAKGIRISSPPQQTPLAISAAPQQGLAPADSDTPTREAGPVSVARLFVANLQEFASEMEKMVEGVLPDVMQHYNIDRETAVEYLAVDYFAALRFERISRGILGSQINAINQLNIHGGRLSVEGLRPIYTAATTLPIVFPDSGGKMKLTARNCREASR
jgi:hypothetical protein